VDTLREGVRVMTLALMELEVAQHLGPERYQRSPDRQGERNGYRDWNWGYTRVSPNIHKRLFRAFDTGGEFAVLGARASGNATGAIA
jgi:hypothetical protein